MESGRQTGKGFEKVEVVAHFRRRNFNKVVEAEAKWEPGSTQRSWWF